MNGKLSICPACFKCLRLWVAVDHDKLVKTSYMHVSKHQQFTKLNCFLRLSLIQSQYRDEVSQDQQICIFYFGKIAQGKLRPQNELEGLNI